MRWGGLAALVTAEIQKPTEKIVAVIGLLGSAVFVAVFAGERFCLGLIGKGTMLMLTFSVALLMVSFHWEWAQRWAAWRTSWLRSCGRMSYEIYLTHMFAVFPMVGLFHMMGGQIGTGWLWFLPTLGMAWVLGFWVTRYFSSPMDRWIRSRAGVTAR